MTRDEFDKKFGNTFFVKLNRWGRQLTDADVAKLGYSITTVRPATTLKTAIKK